MFRTAWTIARFKGVPVRLHVSLLLIVPVIALSVAGRDLPTLLARWGVAPQALRLGPVAFGLLMALALLVAVTLHELGHAVVALRQGARVKGITLMVLGGVTEIEHEDARPGQELAMAFAGPAVNLVLFGLAWAVARAPGLPLDAYVFLQMFGVLNLFLAGFNLIPAFPLDGGRMLRAALRWRMGRAAATQRAATIARVLAIAGGLLGLMHGMPMLSLVALLVFMAAGGEAARVTLGPQLSGLKALQAMSTQLVNVYPHTELAGVARHLLMSGATAAVVRRPGEILGVLLPNDLRGEPPNRLAGSLLEGPPLQVDDTADLADVVEAIQRQRRPAMVFDERNALVGVVTLDLLRRAADLRRLTEGLQAAADRLEGGPVDPR